MSCILPSHHANPNPNSESSPRSVINSTFSGLPRNDALCQRTSSYKSKTLSLQKQAALGWKETEKVIPSVFASSEQTRRQRRKEIRLDNSQGLEDRMREYRNKMKSVRCIHVFDSDSDDDYLE